MRQITHIFFDLHGTIIDGDALHPCYRSALGHYMAERYGGNPQEWAEANTKILLDWDSYYADLDLGGDEAIADMWEGLFRTTRALFRLMSIPEPPHEELTAISRDIPRKVTWGCDAFYPETKAIIQQLYQQGYTLGVMTHALVEQARGLLHGGGMLPYFEGIIAGPDLTECYEKDERFLSSVLSKAQVKPENSAIVEDNTFAIKQAQSMGIFTVQVCRKQTRQESPADHLLTGDLTGLTAIFSR